MADYQRIVDDIRGFLHSSDLRLTVWVKDAAAIYAEACQEVNNRLRRCDEFLRKGLRLEAIHLAQTEPILLDLLAALDFPERSQWVDLLGTYGLPEPAPLQMERASILNEAYADEQPLEELLRKHRKLALARAPLRSRLSVLRRMSQMDAGNPIWQDDIRAFEQVRFRQIGEEFQRAQRHKDSAALATLAEELTRSPWVSGPPPALLVQVQSSAQHEARVRARETIKTLEPQLNEAISAFNLPRARALREQITTLGGNGTLKVEAPLQERLAQAFEWLAEHDKRDAQESGYQKAAADLATGLNKRLPPARLKSLMVAVQQFNRGVPLELERRYRRAVRGRRLLIAVSVLGGVALIAWLGTLWVEQSALNKETASAVKNLKAFVSDGQLEECRQYLDSLGRSKPRVRQAQEVEELALRLQRAESKEKDRRLEFLAAMKEADTSPVPPIEVPALARAKELARTGEETVAVGNLRKSRHDRFKELKVELERNYLLRSAELKSELKQFEDQLKQPYDAQQADERLRELQSKSERLQDEARGVSEQTRAAIDELRTRLAAARQTLEVSRVIGQSLFDLTRALTAEKNIGDFVAAARQYMQKHPDTQRSRDLKRAIDERDLWQDVLDWNRLLAALPNKLFETKPADAKQVAEKWRKFLEAHGKFVDIQPALEGHKYLLTLAQGDDKESGTAGFKLRQLFSTFPVKDLWCVRLVDGQVIYMTEKEGMRTREATETSFLRATLVGPEPTDLRPRRILRSEIQQIGPAPQSLIADQYVLRALPARDWDKAMLALLKKLHTDPDLDPILKFSLLERTADYAGQASHPLAEALGAYRQGLEKIKPDLSVPWMDPDSVKAQAVRKRARADLAKLPPFDLVEKAAGDRRRQIETALARTEHKLAGWVARGEGTSWRLCSHRPLAGEHELYVVLRGSGATAEWRSIGKLVNGKADIKSSAADALLEGRWVFLVPAAPVDFERFPSACAACGWAGAFPR